MMSDRQLQSAQDILKARNAPVGLKFANVPADKFSKAELLKILAVAERDLQLERKHHNETLQIIANAVRRRRTEHHERGDG
jgi:hypothetical protein